MEKKDIRVIALDLDGTALTGKKEFTKRTLRAFRWAMDHGIQVVAATGRTWHSLPEQLFEIGGIEYAALSNGAAIARLSDGEIIYRSYLKEEQVEPIVEIIRNAKASIETFIDGQAYMDQEKYDLLLTEGSRYRNVDYIRRSRKPVKDIFRHILDHRDQIEIITLNFESLQEKEKWSQMLEKVEGITLTTSVIDNLEISGPSTSKGAALEFLLKQMGFTADQLMTCGDNINDLEMIRMAGIGVAVGNAMEEVKEASDYVTDTNDNDGVAKAIEKFLEIPDLSSEGGIF